MEEGGRKCMGWGWRMEERGGDDRRGEEKSIVVVSSCCGAGEVPKY
jgi:hypothetical protein